jgi:uncharacterized delta-60 repeat protein
MKYLFLFFSLLFARYITIAQAGAPDKTFGDNGLVVDKNLPGYDTHIAYQKDGKYVVSINLVTVNGFSIARYNTEGIIDSSFGKNGLVTPVFSNGTGYCSETKMQADNKLLACGAINHSGINNIMLLRYIDNGEPDPFFGKQGLVDFNIEPGISSFAIDFAIQPDGKIVVIGKCNKGINGSYIPFIIRLDDKGDIDKQFGSEGKVYIASVTPTEISSVIIKSTGNIIIGGTYSYLSSPKFMTSSYFNSGVLDKTYGLDGIALYSFGDGTFAKLKDIALQGDEKIVCGGYSQIVGSPTKMSLVRFDKDGKPDSTFDDYGAYIIQSKDESLITNVLVQDDNKLLAAGSFNPSGESSQFAIVRIMPDGRLDSSFGINGLSLFPANNSYYCNDALLQNDNKIMLAGNAYITEDGQQYLALIRYNNNPSKKQIIITKIKKWLQHHNGFTWDANSTISSYVIQRSYDGTHFNSIARINAGSSSNYTYTDASPLSGNNYYRLQTTSTSGAVNYSNVIAVTNSDIKISPNPAKNSLQIQGLPSNTKVTVVDFVGNIKLQTEANTNNYNLNIASLKAGNYLLKIETKDNVVTKKFVKE